MSTRTIGFCTDIIEKIAFEESELHKELDNIRNIEDSIEKVAFVGPLFNPAMKGATKLFRGAGKVGVYVTNKVTKTIGYVIKINIFIILAPNGASSFQ